MSGKAEDEREAVFLSYIAAVVVVVVVVIIVVVVVALVESFWVSTLKTAVFGKNVFYRIMC